MVIIQKSADTSKLYGSEADGEPVTGFDEIEQEAEEQVTNHKEFEPDTGYQFIVTLNKNQEQPKGGKKNDLVQRYRMAQFAIAEVHSPG